MFLAAGLALTFPMVLTVAWLGHPDPGPIVSGYLGALLLAGAYLSVGVCTSAMTRNQVISFVVSFIVCLFLLMAGWPPVTEMLVKWAPNWLVTGVAAFSVSPHFESIQRGVLDVRDFIYYFSVMGVMLFAAYLVIENRKSA